MTERVSKVMKAVGAPARTPWVAYPFSLLMFGVFAWRQYHHGAGAETLTHAGIDMAYLAAGIAAIPPLRDAVFSGASKALDLYRAYRAAKKEPDAEGDR